jgi:hypothetical protein
MARGLAVSAAGLALLAATLPAAPGAAVEPPDPAGPAASQEQAPVRYFEPVAAAPAEPAAAVPATAGSGTSTVTPDGRTVIHADAAGKRLVFVDITNPAAPQPAGELALEGRPTAVRAAGGYLLAAVEDGPKDDAGRPGGQLSVFRAADRIPVTTLPLGGRPLSLDVTADGRYAAVAVGTPGGLAVLDLQGDPRGWKLSRVALPRPKGPAAAPRPAAQRSPESGQVVIGPDGVSAAVTLPDANGAVLVDLRTGTVRGHVSAGAAGAVSWLGTGFLATANRGGRPGSAPGWTVFAADTGRPLWEAGGSFSRLALEHGLPSGQRSGAGGPDSLTSATYDGVPYLFTGSAAGGFVAVYNVADPARPEFVQVLPSLHGPAGLLPIPGRGLLAVAGGSGSDGQDFGQKPAQKPGQNGGIPGIQVYRLGGQSGPGAYPRFPTIKSAPAAAGEALAPWGGLGALTADPASPDRLYTATGATHPPARILTLDTSGGAPGAPALLTGELPVTRSGKPAGYDIEGLWAKPDGGFWLAAEGAAGRDNRLVETDPAGAVLREVELPRAVADDLGPAGLQGVTGHGAGADQVLYTVLQRETGGDPAGVVRIGRFSAATGEWSWFGYRLEPVSGGVGNRNGLAEVTAVDHDTLAVIERDQLDGPAAALKAVYTVELPPDPAPAPAPATTPATTPAPHATTTAPAPPVPAGPLTVLPKQPALDVLPTLRAAAAWTPEKLEGLAIGGDGQVYAVTDNGGATGAGAATVFLRLGPAAGIFAGDPAPSPSVPAAPAPDLPAPAPVPAAPADARPADPFPVIPATTAVPTLSELIIPKAAPRAAEPGTGPDGAAADGADEARPLLSRPELLLPPGLAAPRLDAPGGRSLPGFFGLDQASAETRIGLLAGLGILALTLAGGITILIRGRGAQGR